jgi:hypothetical protein
MLVVHPPCWHQPAPPRMPGSPTSACALPRCPAIAGQGWQDKHPPESHVVAAVVGRQPGNAMRHCVHVPCTQKERHVVKCRQSGSHRVRPQQMSLAALRCRRPARLPAHLPAWLLIPTHPGWPAGGSPRLPCGAHQQICLPAGRCGPAGRKRPPGGHCTLPAGPAVQGQYRGRSRGHGQG